MAEPCPICEGAGLRIVQENGRQVAVDCVCRVQRRTDRLLERAHIPKRYEHCSLESFDTHFPSSNRTLTAAHLRARRFVEGYPVETNGTGLLLTGSIGVVTGKLVARDLKDRLGVGSGTVRTNANADAWSVNAPFTEEQQAHVEAEADLFYTDFVHRVADGRRMSAEAVDQVARGRVWTGADALERGLVDELGGLRTAIARAKALAGIDEDTKVHIAHLPGSSLRDMLRPKASSQPAAASVTEMVSALAVRSLTEVVDQSQRSLTGVNVLWLGASRY